MSDSIVIKNTIAQLCRFAMVGIGVSTLHLAIVVLLVQHYNLQPLVANVAGFFISFQFSYWGHRLITFNDSDVLHRHAIPKLLTLQIMNFTINEYLFYIFLSLHLPYQLALFMVLAIMPLFTFFITKYLIFANAPDAL